jgi:hypothetical protein
MAFCRGAIIMTFLDSSVMTALASAGVILKDRAKSALHLQCQFAERQGKEYTSPAKPEGGVPYPIFHRFDQGQIPPISHWLLATNKGGRELMINLHTAEILDNRTELTHLVRFSMASLKATEVEETSVSKNKSALRKI